MTRQHVHRRGHWGRSLGAMAMWTQFKRIVPNTHVGSLPCAKAYQNPCHRRYCRPRRLPPPLSSLNVVSGWNAALPLTMALLGLYHSSCSTSNNDSLFDRPMTAWAFPMGETPRGCRSDRLPGLSWIQRPPLPVPYLTTRSLKVLRMEALCSPRCKRGDQ